MDKKDIEIMKVQGAIIRAKRKEMGFTQDFISDMLNLTRSSVVQIELGTQGLKANNIYRLCCILHMQPNDFFPPIVPIQYEEEKYIVERLVKMPIEKTRKRYKKPL